MPLVLNHISSDLRAACQQFIESGGHTTQSFGFGQVIGQIYALLYLSPRSLCLDEIAEELAVSKASVSTCVRQLELWAAVKHVWVKGDRRDFYEAETDFKAVLRHSFLATIRKKLDTAAVRIESVDASLRKALANGDDDRREDARVIAERLQRAREFHRKINALLSNPLIEHLL